MRILDQDLARPVRNVMLLLTPGEAAELRDTLEQLLANPDGNHGHVSDASYQREVTVAIYTPENYRNFASDVVALIESDE